MRKKKSKVCPIACMSTRLVSSADLVEIQKLFCDILPLSIQLAIGTCYYMTDDYRTRETSSRILYINLMSFLFSRILCYYKLLDTSNGNDNSSSVFFVLFVSFG